MRAAEVVLAVDNRVLADHLVSVLEHWGLRVTAVASSTELALAAITRHSPDLLLVDLALEEDSEDLRAAREIRRATRAPIVFLTSLADPTLLARLDQSGAHGWVAKPVCDRALLMAIDETVARGKVATVVRQHATWLEATLHTAGEAAVALEGDGRVVVLNDRVAEETGLAQSSALARAVTGALRHRAMLEVVDPARALKIPARRHTIITLGPGSSLDEVSGYEPPIDLQVTPIRGAAGQVTGSVVTFHDRTSSCASGQRLAHLALHDPLTSLANRTLFFERLRQAVSHSRRNGRMFALHILDLDYFKAVNDTLGHAAGDGVLVETATRIVGCVRETDTVARLGGDELAVIQVDLDGPDGAVALADKLLEVVTSPIPVEGSEVRVSASIGIALCLGDREAPAQILRCADGALFTAKARGRGRHALSSPSGGGTDGFLNLAPGDLRRALDRSELETYLQPTFSLSQRRLTGAEALVRWNHPEEGLLPASSFISAAERHGVIGAILNLSLNQACAAAASWLSQAPAVPVSINLSTSTLESRALVETIDAALRATSLPPGWLEIELCGRLAPARLWDELLPTLHRLSDMGVSICLDRFGRDPWSLPVLGMLPVTKVKIDQGMLHGVPDDPRATRMLQGTLNLLNRLDIEVVAVGVETEDQLEWLRQSGCHHAQGHRLGPPVRIDTFRSQHLSQAS